MVLFLASVLEQLDLALEHVSKRDVHNARFGIMLIDNAVELVLHQIALDQSSELRMFGHMREDYPHQSALNKALGKDFEAKVKFARTKGYLNEKQSRTINIMHGFRNEVYHVGIQHEAILPSLSSFYFDVACEFIGSYKSRGLSWGSNMKLPDRAKKYFSGDWQFPAKFDDFNKGCESLSKSCGHDPADTVSALADHMDQIIEQQDICIDIVSKGVYEGQQTTRDRAVVDDLPPINRSRRLVGFPVNLDERRSDDEAQTVYGRADHIDPEGT